MRTISIFFSDPLERSEGERRRIFLDVLFHYNLTFFSGTKEEKPKLGNGIKEKARYFFNRIQKKNIDFALPRKKVREDRKYIIEG